ncbi:helix-turn-helix domain-containing protein [Enterococcus florum]|nr:RodZ domain-containing protein [Enterococcus florum]
MLQKARTQQHITLDVLQQKTKIPKRYLLAIEDNDFERLPSEYYVRTFIRQYAEVVKVDADHLLAIYDGKDKPPSAYEEPKAIGRSRTNKHVADPRKLKLQASLPTIILGLIALSIVIIVGYMTWLDHRSEDMITRPSSIQVEDSSSSAEPPAASEVPATSPEPPQMTATMENDSLTEANMRLDQVQKPARLTFTGKTGQAWIGVQINDVMVYQHVLQPEETQTTDIPADATHVLVVAGVADYVNVQVNDQPLDFQPNQSLNQKNIRLTLNYAA